MLLASGSAGRGAVLVRNHDYDAQLVGGVILLIGWSKWRVIGGTDCLIGPVDGMNDAGLAVSRPSEFVRAGTQLTSRELT